MTITSLQTERAQQLYERGKHYEWTEEELPWQLGTKLRAEQRRQGGASAEPGFAR